MLVARYRFNWENLPAGVLRAVADNAALTGPPAAALRRAYGARPRSDFVVDAWPVLLERWLPRAKDARQAIVEDLRSHKLGAWEGRAKSAAEQIQYLKSCRNSPTLREAVLTQLILAGEADLAPVPKAKPVSSESPAPHIDTTDAPKGLEPTSLTEFVDTTLRSHLGVTEIHRDDDGDVPVRTGTSMCFVRIDEHDDMPSRIIFICPLVNSVKISHELLESLNEINLQLTLGKVVLSEDRVVLEAEVLADTLSAQELQWALDVMTSAADYFDTKLVARYGGQTFFDETGSAVDV